MDGSLKEIVSQTDNYLVRLSSKTYDDKKADDKSFICKFSNNVKYKLYHIENSKTRGQTV